VGKKVHLAAKVAAGCDSKRNALGALHARRLATSDRGACRHSTKPQKKERNFSSSKSRAQHRPMSTTAAVANPSDALRATLTGMAEKTSNAALQVTALTERMQQGELSTGNGVSFLEVLVCVPVFLRA
jgi:hypothetical protein